MAECTEYFNRNRVSIITSFVFSFVHYGLGMRIFYQPDIIHSIDYPLDFAEGYVKTAGRLVAAAIYWILRSLCRSYSIFFYVSLVLGVVIMVVTITCFAEMIKRIVLKTTAIKGSFVLELGVSIIACLTIANIFSAEYFLYPNSTVSIILDIFLCVLASKSFYKLVEGERKKKNACVIIACLLIAVFVYEPPLAVFVILCVMYTVIFCDDIKSFAFSQIMCAGFYGFAMGTKLLYTKLISRSTRAEFDVSSLSDSALAFAPKGKLPVVFIFDRITIGMWTYVIVCGIAFSVIVYKEIRSRQYINVFKVLYVSTVVVIMGVLPFIAHLSNDYRPRIYYPLGCLFGILIIVGISRGIFTEVGSASNKILIALIFVLCMAQWHSFVDVYDNQYITNYDDERISRMIGHCIDEYEKSNNQTISYVTFYSDAIRTKYIDNKGWCITQRAYDAEWSKLDTLNFFLKKSYNKGKINDEIAQFFINQNWDTFSTDQLIFDGDTVHVCTY